GIRDATVTGVQTCALPISYEGTFWKVPKRHVLPKPYQKPHPPMYLACTQTESYDVAADNGIGVLSSATFATNILAEHVKRYRTQIGRASCRERYKRRVVAE